MNDDNVARLSVVVHELGEESSDCPDLFDRVARGVKRRRARRSAAAMFGAFAVVGLTSAIPSLLHNTSSPIGGSTGVSTMSNGTASPVATSPNGAAVVQPAASDAPFTTSEPPCTASQLAASLEDINNGGTQTFGWVIIRNTAAAGCWFTGKISLVGVDVSGKPNTNVLIYPVQRGLLLSPLTPPVPDGSLAPGGEHVAYLVVASSQYLSIGSNKGADCNASNEVNPDAFRLDINGTGTLVVKNLDPSVSVLNRLAVCQGILSAATPILAQPN